MSQTVQNQTAATVIFDGDCQFCRNSVEDIRRHDPDNRLEFLPRQAPESEQRFPQIKNVHLNDGILFIGSDGRVHVAADAIYEISKLTPRWLLALPMRAYPIPVIKQIIQIAYRLIANNRKRLGCNSEYCNLGK